MSSINKVILIGNLGADPEIRHAPSGDAIASLRVATSETWKDKQTGEKKEATEWHRVSVFGRLAEICGEYLRKGSKVYIEGRLQTRKWQDKDGQDRYTTEIRADQMRMLSGRQDDQQGQDHADQGASNQQQGGGQQQRSQGAQGSQGARRQPAQQGSGGGFADFDDDIPF